MKVFAVAVAEAGSSARLLAAEYDLSSFGFFQRGSIQEFLNFFAKTAAERTRPGDRQKIEQD
ncbi:palmitoyltransferase, partial [Quaeritorhiza haematococci]